MASNKLISIQKLLIPFLVFVIAAFVYSQYGFDGYLVRDHGLYLYSGQRVAEGSPLESFYGKGPLSPIFAGLMVIVSKQLFWDDIYTVRLGFLIVSCLAAVSVYLIGNNLFQSRKIGFFAALTFLGYFGFARSAIAGPEPKTLLVLFVTLSLLMTSQRKWFLAGLCGSLSFFTWQPMVIFPLVTLMLAIAQPRKERLPAISRTVAGIVLPAVVIGAYFHHYGALYELLDRMILFYIKYSDRGPSPFISHFLTPLRAVFFGYTTMFAPILIGFIMVVYTYFWRRLFHHSWKDTLTKDTFAPILLSFPFLVVWSLLDFQWVPDFYVFLPYTAIGFSKFLDIAVQQTDGPGNTALHRGAQRFLTIGLCTALIALAVINMRLLGPIFIRSVGTNVRISRGQEFGLDYQKQAAAEIENRFRKDVKIVSIGAPEILAILHRTNPNPYVFINGGIDRRIHANTPGGFEGWLQELEDYDPDVIVFRSPTGIHIYKLMKWLESKYHKEQIGPWEVFVKNSLDR